MTSDPSGAIPGSVLQNSLKIINEAPRDLKSNIKRALSNFDESHFERAESHKLSEFKGLIFGLCMFHSLILGRNKFGTQGWANAYNINDSDLRICGDILHDYLENYREIPYNNLR